MVPLVLHNFCDPFGRCKIFFAILHSSLSGPFKFVALILISNRSTISSRGCDKTSSTSFAYVSLVTCGTQSTFTSGYVIVSK